MHAPATRLYLFFRKYRVNEFGAVARTFILRLLESFVRAIVLDREDQKTSEPAVMAQISMAAFHPGLWITELKWPHGRDYGRSHT